MTAPHRLRALACCALLGGCGGGGSAAQSASPHASATPTAVASAAGSTAYTVSSVPVGLAISYSSGATTVPARTPVTLTPALSNVAFAISFAPDNGNAAYTFVGDQRNDGTRPVLYNERADTTGSIASVSPSAATRVRAQHPASPALRQTNAGAAGRPSESATRVVVRYRASQAHDPFVAVGGRRLGPPRGDVAAAVLHAPAGSTARAYAAQLRARPDVVDAWPDVLEYAQSTTPVMPNDAHFDAYQQWSAYVTGAVNAWAYTQGDPAIAIAVIDTGADFSLPDFAGKIGYAESDVDGLTQSGTATAQDTDGHGTNVAGIAAAATNNAAGFAGIGFNTSLQVYRVFASDTAANGYAPASNASDVTLAISSAVAHGARVINLSLGQCAARGYDVTQQAAIEDAIASGVVVVAASGNERGGASTDPQCAGANSTIDFPAAYDGVISVGASRIDDSANPGVLAGSKESVATYSNDGPALSLVAPGGQPTSSDLVPGATPDQLHFIDGLYSTTAANPNAQCKVPADCRASFAGTSQATAHVAGAAALLLAADRTLDVARVRSLLLANADDIGDPNQGSGRLNIYRALAALEGDPNPPSTPAAHDFVAFAYVKDGSSKPKILDVTYPAGVPVASDGAFRIADVPADAPAYAIGVWSDANGDGAVDAGDYFAASGPCDAHSRCASASALVPRRVGAGFTLP